MFESQFFEKIFQGKILTFPKTSSSIKLVNETIQFLNKKEKINYLNWENNLSKNDFYNLSLKIKKLFSEYKYLYNLLNSILNDLKLNSKNFFFDKPRLRIIPTYLHKIKEAKPAFAIHRDTWYANPEHQINFWIPIHDINTKNSFTIYPDYFQKPVLNNSIEFDYQILNLQGGFASKSHERIFPDAKEKIIKTNQLIPILKKGDILVFSSQHLHATNPNLTKFSRFSIDFRIYFKKEFDIIKNVDNDSKGSIKVDYKNFE